MKIILDPSREGCDVWFLERNSHKILQGKITEICDRLYRFCTNSYKDEHGVIVIEQCVDIALDDKGIGAFYRDYLTNHYSLTVKLIRPEKEYVI